MYQTQLDLDSGSTEQTVPDDERTDGAPVAPRGFLSALTDAMRGVAERERERASADVDAAAAAHLEKVRERATAEAAELERLAEEDIDGIRGWAADETARIQAELEHRVASRRDELQSHLARHGEIIDGEVGHLERAVDDYRNELATFFDRLVRESDPTTFARAADEMPALPDLRKVGGAARADAVAVLVKEEHASDEAVAEAVASIEVEHQRSGSEHAFDPKEPGPDLVPVMAEPSMIVEPFESAEPTVPAETDPLAEPAVLAAADEPAEHAEPAENAAAEPAVPVALAEPAVIATMAVPAGQAADPAPATAASREEHASAASRLIRSIRESLSSLSEPPADRPAWETPVEVAAEAEPEADPVAPG
jgi:hypothetical protein